jgi:hypothetical protein
MLLPSQNLAVDGGNAVDNSNSDEDEYVIVEDLFGDWILSSIPMVTLELDVNGEDLVEKVIGDEILPDL